MLRNDTHTKYLNFLLLSFLVLFFYYEYLLYPPFLWGEELSAILHSEEALGKCSSQISLFDCIKYDSTRYNKGYSWLTFFLLPLIKSYTTSQFALEKIIRTIILIFPLSCIYATALIFKKQQPKHWFLSALSCLFLGVLLISFRRYKWHTIILFTILTPYVLALYFQTLEQLKPKKHLLVMTFVVFFISIFFYMPGFFMSIPLLCAFVLYSFRNKQSISYKLLPYLTALAIILIAVVAYYISVTPDMYYRIENAYNLSILTDPVNLYENNRRTKDFFLSYINPITLILLFIGLGRVIQLSKNKDFFAQVHLFTFIYISAFIYVIEGFGNADYAVFFYIPMLMTLMYAVTFLLDLVSNKNVLKFLLIFILLTNSYSEATSYKALTNKAYYQGASRMDEIIVGLTLKHMLAEKTNGTRCYYLPIDGFPIEQGGFQYYEMKRYFPEVREKYSLTLIDPTQISAVKNKNCSRHYLYLNANHKPNIPHLYCDTIILFPNLYPYTYKVNQCRF